MKLENKAEVARGGSAFMPDVCLGGEAGKKQPSLVNSSLFQETLVGSKARQEREEPKPDHHPAGFSVNNTQVSGSVDLSQQQRGSHLDICP